MRLLEGSVSYLLAAFIVLAGGALIFGNKFMGAGALVVFAVGGTVMIALAVREAYRHRGRRESPTRVYLAAMYSRREEMQHYAVVLGELGFVVDARWITGQHEPMEVGIAQVAAADLPCDEGLSVEMMCVAALEDIEDIEAADILVVFTERPDVSGASRGGRHVEYGLALALGTPVVVVGPRENVFHALPEVHHFDQWSSDLFHVLKAHSVGAKDGCYCQQVA